MDLNSVLVVDYFDLIVNYHHLRHFQRPFYLLHDDNMAGVAFGQDRHVAASYTDRKNQVFYMDHIWKVHYPFAWAFVVHRHLFGHRPIPCVVAFHSSHLVMVLPSKAVVHHLLVGTLSTLVGQIYPLALVVSHYRMKDDGNEVWCLFDDFLVLAS
jgi:hypothetical protein